MELEFSKLEFHVVKKKKKKTQMETEIAKHDFGTIPVYLFHIFIPLSSNVVPLSHRPYFSQSRRPSLSLRSLSVTGAPHVPDLGCAR